MVVEMASIFMALIEPHSCHTTNRDRWH